MTVMERDRWTDERLEERFNRVDADIHELRTLMREGFERSDKRFDQVDRRFERMEDKFDTMQRNMTFWFISLFSSIIALAVVGSFG